MQSIADGLPPEVAQQIHPDWWRNEKEYWASRDQLIAQYRNQWIAFANGAVVASGTRAVEVFHAAQQSGLHPYVTCVGREKEPCRMRRMAFAYDQTYPTEALPLVTVEFRKHANQPGLVFDRVIPDTGADASAVPWSDCQRLQLDPSQGLPGLIGGVGGSSASTVVFSIWAHLDGNSYPCQLQVDFGGDERILGRDVLNRVNVLFRGPGGEIVVNP
jgi:hypothetical protein